MTSCQAVETDLTNDEALVILEPYFVAVQDQYLVAGLDRVRRTDLSVSRTMHDTDRHYAGCRDDGTAMMVAPELAELDPAVVLAIFSHEFGHATDFLYPGEFVVQGETAARRPREPDNKHWVRWVKAWENRDADTVEFTADAIAELVLGVRYGYLGPCLVQSFDATKRRPKGLR